MTIIIPTWIVITIIILFVLRSIVTIKRGHDIIKGLKAIWPDVKEFMKSETLKDYIEK